MKKFNWLNLKELKKHIRSVTVLPYFILLITLIISVYLSISGSKKQIERNCKNSLVLLSQTIESEISNITHSTTYLFNSENLMNYLQNKGDTSASDTLSEKISPLSHLKDNNNMIQDIFIIDKTSDIVISTTGTYPMNEFFSEVYSYANYSAKYWSDFHSFSRSSYIILSPSRVSYAQETLNVVPIVFNTLGSANLSKTMVINFSLDALSNTNLGNSITENSEMFILSRYTGDVFGLGNNYDFGNILDSELYNDLTEKKTPITFSRHGKKTLAVASNLYSGNLLGFTYFVTIPYIDIYRSQSLFILGLLVFYVVFLGATIYLSMEYQKKSLKMVFDIAHLLTPNTPDDINNKNIFNYITSTITSMHKKNTKLNMLVPFSQEKYLIDYITSQDLYIDADTKTFIKDSLPFNNEYFAIVIFQIFPKGMFFDAFSSEEYDIIFYGFNDIIKSIFANYFNIFSLSSERETMYIVLNSDNTGEVEKINNTLKEVYTILQYDSEHLNLYTGVGNFHKDLEGLKKSYSEAMLSIKHIPFQKQEFSFSKNSSYTYLISKKNESELYDSLTLLDTTAAKNIINDLTKDLSNIYTIKHIYLQVINIILKVFQTKNIYNAELCDSCSTIIDKSCKDIYAYILQLLSLIEVHRNTLDSRQSGDEIIEYIKENFSDTSISLESLADQFNLTSGYISQLVKKNIGTNFRDYLLNLRLSYAKDLLTNSDKSVQEIYEESGFYSKQTFFRVFKNNTGITPIEFRKNISNQ